VDFSENEQQFKDQYKENSATFLPFLPYLPFLPSSMAQNRHFCYNI
jgi:hypothetical protein